MAPNDAAVLAERIDGLKSWVSDIEKRHGDTLKHLETRFNQITMLLVANLAGLAVSLLLLFLRG